MQLPVFLPKELEYLRAVANETELFAEVTGNRERAVQFLQVAGEEEAWAGSHPDFMKKLLKWLNELFYRDQLNIELAEKVQAIMHDETAALAPYLFYDMKVKMGDEEEVASSLLLAMASPYFLRLVRQMAARNERILKLPAIEPFVVRSIFELLHKGAHNLWRKPQEELEQILTQCQLWDLKEIADECEELLVRYVKLDNVVDILLKARKKRWFLLESAATHVYNEQELGLKLYAPEHGVLAAEFLDLKELTTLHAYEKVASLISICKFNGRLASDPDLATVLKMTPHLTGLDFTETDAPPHALKDLSLNITSLNLKRAHWLSDEWVEKLVELYPHLSRVNLEDVTWVGIGTWSALATLPSLCDLDLTGLKQLEDTDLSLIALNPSSLERLSLAKCKTLSAYGIQEILKAAPRLTYLNLSHTSVSDVNLAEISIGLHYLEAIDLSHAAQITEKGLLHLRKHRPALRVIY